MKEVKIYFSKKKVVAFVALMLTSLVVYILTRLYFSSREEMWWNLLGAPVCIFAFYFIKYLHDFYKQRLCMTITYEYLEVNNKFKWTVCFRDVDAFYLTKYKTLKLIGIQYKKEHENWKSLDEIEEGRKDRLRNPDAPGAVYEIPINHMDIKPHDLLNMLNERLKLAHAKEVKS